MKKWWWERTHVALKWWWERYRMVVREVVYSKQKQIIMTGFINQTLKGTVHKSFYAPLTRGDQWRYVHFAIQYLLISRFLRKKVLEWLKITQISIVWVVIGLYFFFFLLWFNVYFFNVISKFLFLLICLSIRMYVCLFRKINLEHWSIDRYNFIFSRHVDHITGLNFIYIWRPYNN